MDATRGGLGLPRTLDEPLADRSVLQATLESLGVSRELDSIILLAPSWGATVNGVMTLSGAWEKLRTDPVLRFLAVAIAFYGMSTFEGSMMAIRTVNALSHYTEWTIGHVHSGAIGWVAMISFGTMYYLIPRLFGCEIYRPGLVNLHFWLSVAGITLYVTSMWVGGIMQGLMWRALDADGTLSYSFVESMQAVQPFYVIRFVGGVLVLAGACVMAYNLWKSISGAEPVDAPIPDPVPAR